MTFTNESQMPRTWGILIFCNAVSSLLFPAPLVYFAVVAANLGDHVWVVIWGVITAAVFFRKDSRYWRSELYLRLHQREAIRLTKHIHIGFQLLEDGQLYAGRDVTQGHGFRVVFLEDTAFVMDPTGFFLFDPKNWPVALWAESLEKLSFFNPQPATPDQLRSLIARIKTYR